jgi:iron complex transport system permease protein
VDIPPWTVVKILLNKLPGVDLEQSWPASWDTVIWQLRLPRVLLAGLVGATLAVSGATYQGLFRNPLAEPYLLGVAAGAALGATALAVNQVPVYFNGFSILPIVAFAGALAAVATAYLVARQMGTLPLTNLILAGVAVASLAGAVTSFLIIRSTPDVKPLLSWLLGGFAASEWKLLLIVLPYILPSFLVMMAYGRILNLFQLQEEEAKHLGVNIERAKLVLIVAASLATAAAVSVSGIIGFVGLIAPHAVRLLWGPDHRFLLPMSMLVGAGFLVIADLVARTALTPTELPVGVVTAFCGAPFFLYLLRRSMRVS